MGDTTKIEWTDRTWNPWFGCTPISAGCKYCYALWQMTKYNIPEPHRVRRASITTFNKPLAWAKRPESTFVFTCSWGDFFHEDGDKWRAEAWSIIKQTPTLCYLILTKRPQNIATRLPPDWDNGYSNVWLGVTAENQQEADKRLPFLLAIPAVKRFVSCEPLLGPINLKLKTNKLDWIIAGGETGKGARPMALSWATSLRDQCLEYNIPFFLKQLGGYPRRRDGEEATLDGHTWKEQPEYNYQPKQKLETLKMF